MDSAQLNWLTNFIWNIADDVLRDVYVRGKYRDVILPMTVLRRLDAVLEPTKQAVLEMKAALDREQVTNQDDALRAASGQAFYNTSPFLLRDLKSRATQQKLRDDFEVYLDGFSPNVQDILENFEFRNQIPRLSKADALGQLIEKFLDKDINISPYPVDDKPALDNHSMGTMFEELVRRFNEDNNEEAGEHWTPRDAVRLMANLMFLPVADKIESGTYLLYDCACGTGGMLTVAEETLQQIAKDHGKQVATHLYGQEINGETYAICKADLLLKGDGDAADNIVGGPEHSTLANDAFRSREFDFMLANPPYGKSWKSDLERMGGKAELRDPRFKVMHDGEELSLLTRSSDGQMLFLANMLSKMKHDTPLGSRIAEVHNGSSLFTGDAGQGESNIRRWIIENDWLEAIVALPLNLFYNTGIATYVWVLTNRKPEKRRGMVQLIDATQWFRPLRKNMGKKNCELAPEDIQRICQTFLAFEETPQSKIFPNAAFGYWKVKVERPLRLVSQLTRPRIETLRFASGDEEIRAALYEELGDALFEKPASVRKQLEKLLDDWGSSDAAEDDEETEGTAKKSLPEKKRKKLLDPDTWKRDAFLVDTATKLRAELGGDLFPDHNVFLEKLSDALKTLGIKLSASDHKLILNAVSWRDENAPPVIKKIHKPGKFQPDPLRGLYEDRDGSPSRPSVLEYEPDPELRDYEQIPLLEEGGIEAFIRREVLPYTPDAWIVEADTKIGYEVSFTRHFYEPPKLRTLAEISADILKLEQETEGLLSEITKGVTK
jgi:type I restriction enzyme M protein